MPFYRSNNGVNSQSEQFALKKNQAFQAHCDDSLAAMTRGYYHRRDNLQQEIKAIYREMKDIKISTGYSLDKVRSAHPGGPFRNPNTPTVYLPPIGIRLMKDFVGLDVRTDALTEKFKSMQSSANNHKDGKEINTVSGYIGKTMVTKKGGVVRVLKKKDSGKKVSSDEIEATTDTSLIDTEEFERNEDSHEQGRTTKGRTEELQGTKTESVEVIDEHEVERSATLVKEYSEIADADPLFCLARERHFTKDSMQLCSEDGRDNNQNPVSNEVSHVEVVETMTEQDADKMNGLEASNKAENRPNSTISIKTEDSHILEKRYNCAVRRSSRSTFRTRSSIRLPGSSESHLSDHNKEMIALSQVKKTNKLTSPSLFKDYPEKFYLDYGDGTLHDTMSIPKIKDCARQMCKAYCKTCQKRTTGKPCFVLVPATQNYRRRLLPNETRQQISPMYQPATSSIVLNPNTEDQLVDSKEEPFSQMQSSVSPERQESDRNDNANSKEESENKSKEQGTNEDTDADLGFKNSSNKIDQILQQRKKQRQRKGYSKQRIDELSMPRGGPPAEVRFSKMTLRKKQNQLIEEEKVKSALSEYEKQNQELIQAKISMFLAVLNQQEYQKMPRHMVHLPIPINILQEKLEAQTKVQPVKKKVQFKLKRSV